MTESRNVRLRVGVVGLGKLWEGRHKPALARMADRFQVTALYDQVARRAALEANALRCAAAEGLAALVERPDVDVVYLLAPQWFGLHAAELTCAAGKPIYFALPVAGDLEGLEALGVQIRRHGTPLVPELARRFYPATLRLRELLATTLGAPRLIVGHARFFGYDRHGPPGPASQLAPLPMAVDPGANLVDWCRVVFQAEPVSVQGFGTVVLPADPTTAADPDTTEDFGGFTLEFPGGALAQITFGRYHRSAWGEATTFLPPSGFQVFAERGAAWLEMPDSIRWSDLQGAHEERLPLEPAVGEALNDHFHRLVRGCQSLCPTLDDALAAARLVRDLRRSRQEGRRVAIPEAGHPA